MPIYFRAAARESKRYPEALRRTIRRERLSTVAIQLGLATLLWTIGGPGAMLRIWLVPYFFVFPVAFTLNRLGQHYDINPNDPANWSTLVKGSWFWDAAYLFSNYHLEHHYFPGVPFYRLPEVQRALIPFYQRKQMRWRNYGELVYGWLVENQKPHTNWAENGSNAIPRPTPKIEFH